MDIFILPDQLEFRYARAYLKHLAILNVGIGRVVLTDNTNSWGTVQVDTENTQRVIVIGCSVKASHMPYITYLQREGCELILIGHNVSEEVKEITKVIPSDSYIEALYAIVRPDLEDSGLVRLLENCERYFMKGGEINNNKEKAFVSLMSSVSSDFIESFTELKSYNDCAYFIEGNYRLLSSIASQRESGIAKQLSKGTVVSTSLGPILVVLGTYANEAMSNMLREQNLSGMIGISPTKGHDLISIVSGTLTAKEISDMLDFPSLGTVNHQVGFLGTNLAKPFIDALAKM